MDSRKLRGGAKLTPEIWEAIEQARQVVERLNIERRLYSGDLPGALRTAGSVLKLDIVYQYFGHFL